VFTASIAGDVTSSFSFAALVTVGEPSRGTILARRFSLCSVRAEKRILHRTPRLHLSRELGLEGAPISDTADPFRHGYGADALAFQFDRAGRLLRAPAYVAQAQVNNFYVSRLGIFIRGKSTAAEVQSIFGRFRRVEQRRDGFIGYYEIEVYNPFEDLGGRGRR